MYIHVCINCWNTWETHYSDKFETQLHKTCIWGTKQSLADYFHIHVPGHCLFLYTNIYCVLLHTTSINSLELCNFLNCYYICNTSVHVY